MDNLVQGSPRDGFREDSLFIPDGVHLYGPTGHRGGVGDGVHLYGPTGHRWGVGDGATWVVDVFSKREYD